MKKTPQDKLLDKTNWIRVNIWTSEKNRAIEGANVGHVSIEVPGTYISLWPGPRGSHTKKPSMLRRLLTTRPANLRPTYESDCIAEGLSEDYREIGHFSEREDGETVICFNKRSGYFEAISQEPNNLSKGDEVLIAVRPILAGARIRLFSLNVGRLQTEYQKFKDSVEAPNSEIGWRLVGSQSLFASEIGKSSESCASLALRLLKAAGMYNSLPKELSMETSSIAQPDIALRHLVQAKEMEITNYSYTRDWIEDGDSSLDEIVQAFSDVKADVHKTSLFSQFCK